MNTVFTKSLCLCSLTLLLAGAPQAVGAKPGPVVTGSGHVSGVSIPLLGEQYRTFTVNAVRHADGSVSGNIQVVQRGTDSRAHVAVDCALDLGDGTVVLTGVYTFLPRFPEFEGTTAITAVRDGAWLDEPDQIAAVGSFRQLVPNACELVDEATVSFFVSNLGDIEEGNIVVR